MNRNKNALKSLLLILTFVVSLFAGTSNALAKGNAYAKGQDRTGQTDINIRIQKPISLFG